MVDKKEKKGEIIPKGISDRHSNHPSPEYPTERIDIESLLNKTSSDSMHDTFFAIQLGGLIQSLNQAVRHGTPTPETKVELMAQLDQLSSDISKLTEGMGKMQGDIQGLKDILKQSVEHTNKRFDQMGKRFDQVDNKIENKHELVKGELDSFKKVMEEKFDSQDKILSNKLDHLKETTHERIDAATEKVQNEGSKFKDSVNTNIWKGVAAVGLIIGALKYLG